MLEAEIVDEVADDIEQQVESETPDEETQSFQVPEKFQGKTPEEIAQSYLELEKELGRKANEVGELRKLTDQYIHQELSRRQVEDPKESDSKLEFDDLVENPDEVLNRLVDKRVKQVDEKLAQLTQQQQLERFLRDNPDFNEISTSQEFASWANATPYRQRQFAQANNFDFDAAQELISAYRDTVKGLGQAQKQGQSAKRDAALKAATAESSGTGESPRKIWTRSELAKLRLEDPDSYWAQSDEIMQAYAEGRVK